MLKSLLPNEVNVKITIDGNGLRSNSTTNRLNRFTKKIDFLYCFRIYSIPSGPLGGIEGFIQLIPVKYKSDIPINITAIDKIHLKSDCINGSIVNGVRLPILFSFALDKPSVHKIYKKPRTKYFKKINEPVLRHIRFFLEDDDHMPVDFNGETISFTCHLNKI